MSARNGAADSGYYLAVEEYFVSCRGDPLFLSNPDWLLVHAWKGEGLPLRVVLRGIADAFEGHAHSWSRGRKVASLAYCRGEVVAAAERWRRALAFGAEEGADRCSQLLSLAQALEQARGLPEATARLADEIAGGLRAFAADPPRATEAWLQAGEQRLRAALAAEVGPARLAAHQQAITRELAAYEERMPAKVLEQVRAESLTRRLFAEHGLPRVSLLL